MPYVPLHVHSINSPYSGLMTPAEIAARAAFLKLPSVALTDSWNTYGHVEFCRAAREAGIRPVLGAEIRHDSLTGHPGIYHLTLLAENDDGYRNLVRLVGLHHGRERAARVSVEDLAGNAGGLIALTGCMRGEANQAVRHGNLGRERDVVERLLGIFGRGNLFLEVMTHNTKWEQFVLESMVRLARQLDVPMVVTNNDRFAVKEQAPYYAVLRSLSDEQAGNADEGETGGEEYYLKRREDLEPFFYFIEDALDNSGWIAERCEVSLDGLGRIGFTDDPDADSTLAEMAERRFLLEFHGVGGEEKRDRRERMRAELESSRQQGLGGFLLFLRAFMRACRRDGLLVEIVGSDLPESLVAYLLGIVPLDPMPHGLVFESFGAPSTGVPPPVELLRSKGPRERFIGLLRSLLPESRFRYQLQREESSFATLVRDLSDRLGVQEPARSEIGEIVSGVRRRQSLNSILEGSERLAHLYGTDPAVRKVLHSANALQGRVSHFVHNSSRIAVVPREFEGMLASTVGPDGEEYVMADSEGITALGGWVLTVQQSHFLSALSSAIAAVSQEPSESRGAKGSLPDASCDWKPSGLDDPATYSMIGAGETMGVYLLESRGIRDLITTIQPSGFSELVNVISLYRPAPLEGRLWQRYVENAEKKGKVLLPHHSLAAPLESTRGLLLYREQVREIIGLSAGIKGEDAAFIEQALLRKETTELSTARLRFIRGAMDHEVDEEDAQKIFDYLLRNIGYTYDKAFSCTQACISYRSAYLKAHYPAEYFAALLDNTEDVKDRRRRYIEHLQANGPRLLPADVNLSGLSYKAQDGAIRAPLHEECDLSEDERSRVLEERERGGPYGTIGDFLGRLSGAISMETARSMVDCGLFDSLGESRERMRGEILAFFEEHGKAGEFFRPSSEAGRVRKRRREEGQLPLFDEENA
ncbi:MAG: PHP domain-containing protein [Candidatus Krumholzibacteria bacterium]|nr:PHP domain-containing protein [Candidatus Krumholzibacteria bacterium]